MNWISFGNGIVAAGVLCALAAVCVLALRALGRKSALFLAVFAAVSVVATIKAQKTNGVNNIPPQQMMIPGEIQGGAASCRANMAELVTWKKCNRFAGLSMLCTGVGTILCGVLLSGGWAIAGMVLMLTAAIVVSLVYAAKVYRLEKGKV